MHKYAITKYRLTVLDLIFIHILLKFLEKCHFFIKKNLMNDNNKE